MSLLTEKDAHSPSGFVDGYHLTQGVLESHEQEEASETLSHGFGNLLLATNRKAP